MNSRKTLRADIKYILFIELYNRLEEPKAKRRAFFILEAAISCFAKKGFESVSMEMIAREAGVTRPLVKYYFKDLQDIQITAVKYIRLLFQKYAIEALSRADDSSSALNMYVRACFDWLANFRTHAKVWLAFIHVCSYHRASSALNTSAVQVGAERITQILEVGVARGEFQCENPQTAARLIQTVITGALISFGSEQLEAPSDYQKMVEMHCLEIASGQ